MVRALRERGDCVEMRKILTTARRLAKLEGMNPELPNHMDYGIARTDDHIRWVGVGTYDLADAVVGLSGRRANTKDEILYLLESRQEIPMAEVIEHSGNASHSPSKRSHPPSATRRSWP